MLGDKIKYALGGTAITHGAIVYAKEELQQMQDTIKRLEDELEATDEFLLESIEEKTKLKAELK